MMRTLGVARKRFALAVLLFVVVAGLPGCVIYATAAPENSAVAAAPPPVEREAEKTSGTTRIDGEIVERETVDRERLERERAEKERAEKERVEKERAEKERAEKERAEKERAEKERANEQAPPTEQVAEENHSPRALEGVPPGHYPKKAGECRLWLADTPPGRQPMAVSCTELTENVPDGAFILYAGKAWDSAYDWPGHAEREQVADEDRVPDIIVQIVRSVQAARAAAAKGTQQD